MLTTIRIANFRGFKELEVNSLKRINLILGQNNTGKTGVLEALTLLLWDPPSQCNDLPSLFRPRGGDSFESFWKWLFFNKDTNRPITVQGEFDNLTEFGVVLQTKRPSDSDIHSGKISSFGGSLGNIPCYTLGGRAAAGVKVGIVSTHPTNPKQDAVDYNRVVLHRKKKQVETLLQKIEPRLAAVETLQTGNEPLLYADIGLSEMIPVTQMGQGFNRLLDVYSEIVAGEAKVLLIDEVENGLHHSVLETIWKGLFHAVNEFDVQIFATTHSWECVLAADKAARNESKDDLNLIRLDRVEENIKVTVIDQEALSTAKELQWEMR